jgi:ABC-2 type transport system permease protein
MNIFKMDFKRNFRTLLVWSLVSAVIIGLFMLLYPSMLNSDMLQLLNAKINSLPAEFINAFHMSGEDFTQLPDFFGYFIQFVLMAACAYGMILGVNALSREQSEGTIEFLYSKPVKRSDIAGAKLASAVVSYLIYFAVFSAAAIISSLIVKPADLPLMGLVSTEKTLLFGCMIAGFTYLFLGFAISVFLKKARHAASLAVAIFFVLYVLGAIPKITGVLDFLKWVSPMEYFVMANIITTGIDWLNVGICIGIMAVCTGIAYVVYRRKDFIV